MLTQDQEQIGAAMGRIPSGCAILTAAHAGQATGMLASWYQQAAFEPPTVTAAVKQGRPIAALIAESGGFVLNLIGENPTALFKHFGKGFSLEQDAFEGLSISSCEFGPVLADAIAVLGCRVTGCHRLGDHDLLVGQVAAARGQDGIKPYVHLRTSGLSY